LALPYMARSAHRVSWPVRHCLQLLQVLCMYPHPT